MLSHNGSQAPSPTAVKALQFLLNSTSFPNLKEVSINVDSDFDNLHFVSGT